MVLNDDYTNDEYYEISFCQVLREFTDKKIFSSFLLLHPTGSINIELFQCLKNLCFSTTRHSTPCLPDARKPKRGDVLAQTAPTYEVVDLFKNFLTKRHPSCFSLTTYLISAEILKPLQLFHQAAYQVAIYLDRIIFFELDESLGETAVWFYYFILTCGAFNYIRVALTLVVIDHCPSNVRHSQPDTWSWL